MCPTCPLQVETGNTCSLITAAEQAQTYITMNWCHVLCSQPPSWPTCESVSSFFHDSFQARLTLGATNVFKAHKNDLRIYNNSKKSRIFIIFPQQLKPKQSGRKRLLAIQYYWQPKRRLRFLVPSPLLAHLYSFNTNFPEVIMHQALAKRREASLSHSWHLTARITVFSSHPPGVCMRLVQGPYKYKAVPLPKFLPQNDTVLA